MAVTIADVRAWDEVAFTNASDARITAAIAMATRQHDAAVWGDLLDDGILLLTCHLLAGMSDGRPLRLVADAQATTYGNEWTRLRQQVGAAYRMLP